MTGSTRESDSLLKKNRTKVAKRKKKKKRRFFTCFKCCIKKNESTDQSSGRSKKGDKKSELPLQPMRIKSAESSKKTTPRSEASKTSIKTEPSSDALQPKTEKLDLKMSSELYGLKKCDPENSNLEGKAVLETKEDQFVQIKTEKHSEKKKKDSQKKSNVTKL